MSKIITELWKSLTNVEVTVRADRIFIGFNDGEDVLKLSVADWAEIRAYIDESLPKIGESYEAGA